jgi:hypothetical protein
MKHLYLASMVLLAASLSSSAALAAPTTDASSAEPPKIPYASLGSDRARSVWWPETLAILKQAQALEKEGKALEALEKYRDAWRIEPYNNTYIELGLAEARLGSLLACARNLQRAIQGWNVQATWVRPIELVREVFTYCKKDLGSIGVKINVPDVRVTIDGEDIEEWPYTSEIFIKPGKHTVKAMKDSYWVNQTDVEVKPGERKPLSIAMQPKYETHFVGFSRPVAFNVSTTARNENDPNPTWPGKVMIASAFGIGLGTGALAMGLVQANNAESKAAATAWTGVASGGGVLLGLGLVGMGVGLAGIASRPTPTPTIYVTPQVAKDGAGVQLAGTIP